MAKRHTQHQQTLTRRNPVARAAILSKGGIHQKSKSSGRHQSKQSLRREVRSLPTSSDFIGPSLIYC